MRAAETGLGSDAADGAAGKSDSIAVLFSGGSDSTLAAALAAGRAATVHLVTYAHPFMFFHSKIDINIGRLREKFPAVRFVVYRENLTPLYRRLYGRGFFGKLAGRRSMLVPHLCGACKLAMHYATVGYCLRAGIDRVYCGAHEESSHVFPAQMEPVIEDTKRMYERHGISYETPVYNGGRTDETLFELGIIDNPRMKDQRLFYTTQHTCPIGALVHLHSGLYYTKLWGHERYERTSQEMVRELMADTEQEVLGTGSDDDTGHQQR